MTRLALNDLVPNTDYIVRVRAVNSSATSDWSIALPFTTIDDTVLPNTPTGATWVAVGDSFHAEWNSVTTNIDGDTIAITRYEIELTAGTTVRIVSVPVVTGDKVIFDLPFNDNKALFGTAAPSIGFRVRAVDNKELKSNYTVSINAQNAVPTAPTSFTASAATDSVRLAWAAAVDDDTVSYNLYVGTTVGFTPSSSNLIWSGSALSFTYTTTTYSPQYFKLYAIDRFGQASTGVNAGPVTPVSPFTPDTTAPATPTSLAATITNNANGVGALAAVSWTMSSPPSDLAGFYIRFRKVGDTNYSNVTFQSADRAGTISLPAAYTNYEFQIKAFDWSNNESAWSSTVTATSPSATAPAQVTGLTGTATPGGILYSWTRNSEANVNDYQVDIATNNTFTTGLITFHTGNSATLNVNGLSQNTTYYARVRAINVAGVTGTYSSTNTTTTGNITVTTVSADIITPGTLGTAGSGIINIGAGATLQTNGGAIKSNTFDGTFTSGVYNNNATAGFYIDNSNVIIPQGKISAAALTTSSISAAVLSLTGTAAIKSGGYVDGTSSTGFQLDASGLKIPNGSIIASKLSIQPPGQNLVTPQYADFEYDPSFYSANVSSSNTATVTTSIDTTIKHINSQSLKIVRTSGSAESVYLGFDNTTNNIVLPNGPTSTSYIVSYFVYGTSTTPVQMKVYDGSTLLTTEPSTALTANTWQRHSFIVTTTSIGCHLEFLLPSSSGTWYIDGIQIEQQATAATTPSSWTPPGATTIDGGAIRTGSIQSNNTALVTKLYPVYDDSGNIVDWGNPTVVIDPDNRPSWFVDTQGDAEFSNLAIRGAVVVGDPNTINSTEAATVQITTTSGSPTATVMQGTFYTADIGNIVVSTNLPANTTISSVSYSTDSNGNSYVSSLTLSANATASGTDANATINRPIVYSSTISSPNYSPGAAGWTIRSDGYAEFQNIAIQSIGPEVFRSGDLAEETVIRLNGVIEAQSSDGTVRVGLSGDDGFYLYGPDQNGVETYLVSFPTDSSKPNIISGTLHSDTLEVYGDVNGNGASFSAPTNTLNSGASLSLASSVQPPNAAPTPSISWGVQNSTTQAARTYKGYFIGHDGNRYTAELWTVAGPTGTNNTYIGLRAWSPSGTGNGALNTAVSVASSYTEAWPIGGSSGGGTTYATEKVSLTVNVLGANYIPNFLSTGNGAYVVVFSEDGTVTNNYYSNFGGDQPGTFHSIKYAVLNTSFTNVQSTAADSRSGALSPYPLLYGSSSKDNFSVGRDFINNRAMIGYSNTTTGAYGLNYYTWTSGSKTITSAAGLNINPDTFAGNTQLIGLGNYDLGANRLVFADASQRLWRTFSSDGTTEYTNEQWYTAATNLRGACYDDTAGIFKSFHVAAGDTTGYAYVYETGFNTWLGSSYTDTWYAEYTYWDDTGTNYETTASTSATITMYKRARLSLSLNQIPYSSTVTNSPTKARIYLKNAATSNVFAYVGNVAYPGRTWVLKSQSITVGGGVGSGGALFPSVTSPGKIIGSNLLIDGLGTAQFNTIAEKTMIGELRMWALSTTTFTTANSHTQTIPVNGSGNWLVCNGQTIYATDYPELVVGLAGTGATSATLPNFTARFPIGAGAATGAWNDNSTLAALATGGSEFISASQMPSHTHGSSNLNTSSAGNHVHTIDVGGSTPGTANAVMQRSSGSVVASLAGFMQNTGAHTHNITGSTDNAGSGNAYLQPYAAVWYIIRAK